MKDEIIQGYINGKSLYALAKEYNTYATSITRILRRNHIPLRHDVPQKNTPYVNDGEKIIKWIKTQNRPVTKKELAELIGRKVLSPSYFEKYPELGQYIQVRTQADLQEYSQKLYKWLKENDILYKPNDRTKLQVSVTALLLGKYKDTILQIAIKPKSFSKRKFEDFKYKVSTRAEENKISVIWIDDKLFENLDNIKTMLDK